MRLYFNFRFSQRWLLCAFLHSFILSGGLVLFLASPSFVSAFPHGEDEHLFIRAQPEAVSVRIAQVSLDEVLKEISRQSRVRLVFHGERQEKIFEAFQTLPLDEALRKLIKQNFLLRYGTDGRLTEIWVLRAPKQPGDSGTGESLDSLIGALDSNDAQRRREAVWLLGEWKEERALAAMMRTLTGDADAEVRQRAAWALENSGDQRAVVALTATVFEDSDESVRQRALEALAKMDDHAAIEPLARALRNDPDPFVRYEALVHLTEIDAGGNGDFLLQALHDPEELVRAKAAEILYIQDNEDRKP